MVPPLSRVVQALELAEAGHRPIEALKLQLAPGNRSIERFANPGRGRRGVTLSVFVPCVDPIEDPVGYRSDQRP
jgi:hypothetical protein